MSNFEGLSSIISNLHDALQHAAVQSVNRMLTIRKWLIGRYIIEYEQCGEDRAKYGVGLLERLSAVISEKGTKGMSVTALRNFWLFYNIYPQLRSAVAEVNGLLEDSGFQIHQTPSDEFEIQKNQQLTSISPDPRLLIRHFSFSHFVELLRISDPLKRVFYETEGINGNWSVAQLKRQIESLLYERTGLSRNKKGLIESVTAQNKKVNITDIIRDPYILEFTGFPERQQFSESDPESALLDQIQAFLLELGHGFCFEARQKRVTLDNEHDRIDFLFYHRVLRCHVLIDLKVRKFTHGDTGQMNYYLNYFRENVMLEDDNPPVGLILCTDRDETVVKYATTGMDNNLFVAKYLTQLPSENTIRDFLTGGREQIILKLNEERAKYGEKSDIQF
jgi:predicted nuclease of restriction endonuclease-like (RecB) superfamily